MLIVTIGLCLIFATPVLAKDRDNQQIEVENIVLENLAKNLYKYYNYNSDFEEKIFSNEVLDYVQAKKKIINHTFEEYNVIKILIFLDAKIVNVDNLENGTLRYSVNVTSKFKYHDTLDTESGEGVIYEFDIINNDNKNQIIRYYERHNYIDENLIKSDNYNEVANQLISNFDKFKSKEETVHLLNDEITLKGLIPEIPLTERDFITAYARGNFNKTNPQSGDGGKTPYKDFSTISGSYDCTNFTSHSLLAGGALKTSGWYFNSFSDRTPSWSGVKEFYTFVNGNTGFGPSTVSVTYSPYPTNSTPTFKKGDILQFHNGSIWRHSTVITKLYSLSYNGRSSYGAMVTGRTAPGVFNDNTKAPLIYGSNAKRVLRLTKLR